MTGIFDVKFRKPAVLCGRCRSHNEDADRRDGNFQLVIHGTKPRIITAVAGLPGVVEMAFWHLPRGSPSCMIAAPDHSLRFAVGVGAAFRVLPAPSPHICDRTLGLASLNS